MANNHKNDIAPMTKEENAAMVEMALKVFKYTDINLRDPTQVEQRITDYFSECVRRGLRPGNMGLYSALGLTRQEIHNIFSGRDRNRVSPESCDMIKKAIRGMAAYRELLGSSGKINPVTLIFWQKNFDGMRDNSQLELEVSRPFSYMDQYASMTPEQIQEELKKRIPVYDDYSPESHPDIVKEIKAEHDEEIQKRLAEDIPIDTDEDS